MEYILSVYNEQGGEVSFKCKTNSQEDIKYDGTVWGKGQITYLSYNKEMYNPCVINVHVCISESTNPINDFRNAFYGKVCSLEASGSIATNYYIHSVKPKIVYENGVKQKILILTIYSMDKLLDIVEECHSYVGQHLCTGILKDGVERYTSGTDYTIETNIKDSDNKITIENLQFLQGANSKELIQPYVVQYNETFYSMLARTANRCGEYMFFEDGKLNIGLAKPEEISVSDSSLLSVRYPRTSVESIFSSIKYNTRSYGNVKKDDNGDIVEDNTDVTSAPEKEGKTGFELNKESSKDFIRDYSIPVDEYILSYTKDSAKEDSVNWLPIIYKVINSPLPFLSTAAIMGIDYGVAQQVNSDKKQATDKNMNKVMNDMKPVGADSSEYEKDSKHNLYSSLDNADAKILQNLNHAGFIIIRRCEEKLANERLIMEINTADTSRSNILLGQKFVLDKVTYIVTKVTGQYDNTKSDNQFTETVEAVPAMTIDGDTYYIPPMIPSGHVRKASPQTAKVIYNQDPKKLGRVRVRYSWQEIEDTADLKEPSPFIRVATPFAAKDGGMYFQLAINEEVMIKYDHGNVERPYVSCSLFNSNVKPPMGTDMLAPDTRVIRSQNGHKIIFSDLSDDAFWNFFSSNPLVSTSLAEEPQPSADGTEYAGGVILSDKGGFYKIEASADQRKIALSSPYGNIILDAFAGISINAPFGDVNIYGKNVNIKARNTVKMDSGIALNQNFLLVYSFDTLTDLIGSTIKEYICDLDIIRTCLERILEPVLGYIGYKPATYFDKVENALDSFNVSWEDALADIGEKFMHNFVSCEPDFYSKKGYMRFFSNYWSIMSRTDKEKFEYNRDNNVFEYHEENNNPNNNVEDQ